MSSGLDNDVGCCTGDGVQYNVGENSGGGLGADSGVGDDAGVDPGDGLADSTGMVFLSTSSCFVRNLFFKVWSSELELPCSVRMRLNFPLTSSHTSLPTSSFNSSLHC